MKKNKELVGKTSKGSIVLAINLFAFGCFFLRDIFATRFFGLNNRMDSVYLGIMIPSLAANFLFQPLSDLLVPKYQYRILNKKNILHFYLNIMIYALAVSVFISIILYFFRDIFAGLLASGFSIENRQLVSYYLLRSIPIVLFGGMIIATNIFLNSINEYIYTACANLLVPLISILSIKLWGGIYGEISFINGMIVGQILNFVAVFIYLLVKSKTHYSYKEFKFVRINKIQVFQYFSQNLVNLCFYGFNTISASFGTHFHEGTTSLIILVNKLIGFFTNLFNNTFSSVFMPYFSRIYLGDKNRFQSENKKFLYILTSVSIVGIIFIYFGSGLISQILFSSSKITADQSINFTRFLEIGIFQIPFFIALSLCFKWLTIYSEFKMLSLFSIIALLVDFSLNLLLASHFGSLSILLAPFLTLAFIMIGIISYMFKKEIGINKKDFFILNGIWIGLASFLLLVLV